MVGLRADLSRAHAMELSCEQTLRSRGVCEPTLEPHDEGEGSRTKGQDFKPDLGNSAVRQCVQERLGASSGGQTHRGKSQEPRSLDSEEEGNRISETYRQSHLKGW